MADDLKELHARIYHDRTEIAEFTSISNAFLADSLSQRNQPMPDGTYLRLVSATKPVPMAIRSRSGMIINDLRSILDALACILAQRNGHTNIDQVYFPISKSKAIFDDDGMRKIKKLSAADQKKIIDLAPYKEKSPILYFLHEADRKRKHQTLAAGMIRSSGMSLGNGAINIRGNSNFHMSGSVVNGALVESFDTRPSTLPPRSVMEVVGREYIAYASAPTSMPVSIDFNVCFTGIADYHGEDVLRSMDSRRLLNQSSANLTE